MTLDRIKAVISRFLPHIVILVTLVSLPASFFIARELAPVFVTSTQIEVTSILINSILTLALVLLYLYSARYQRKLTKIQDAETTAKLRPKVSLDEIKATEYTPILRLSNVGRGAATDLKMRVTPIDIPPEISLERETHILVRHTSKDSEWQAGRANNLRAGENNAKFRENIEVNMVNRGSSDTFPELAHKISKEGDTKYRFKIEIIGDNVLDEPFTEEVLDYVVPVKGGTSLKVAIENGMQYEVYRSSQGLFESRHNRMEKHTGSYG